MDRRLIVDGNSVYEIDMDCLRKRRPPGNCEVYRYFDENTAKEYNDKKQMQVIAKH